jgi:hypothetical protein
MRRLTLKVRSGTLLSHKKTHLYFLLLLLLYPVFSIAVPDSITAVISSFQKLRLFNQISEYEKNNRPAEADSLYGVLDNFKVLSVEQLYRWVHWRELLNRYAGSVEIYCRFLDEDPRFGDAVWGRLYELFEEAPPDSIIRALGVFEKCALCRRGIDTVGVRLRLASVYAGHGLDSAEVNVLAAASGPPARLVPRFTDMARGRYAGGKYAAAIVPAALAYERAGGRAKMNAAWLLSQTYRALHRYDSAVVWIEKSDLSNESGKIEAASLYQCAGKLSEAKALIGALPRSFSRDTLELRQSLYDGDTRSARELAQKRFAASPQYPDETLLWRARTLLFDKAFDDLAVLVDTARLLSSWPGSSALLDCRLMLNLLQGSPSALAAWSHVEYDMFTGSTGRAAGRLSEKEIPLDYRTILLVHIIKELLAQGDTAAVIPLFREQGGNVDSPEYLYLYAEHLLRAIGPEQTSGPKQAREILLRIMRDYPGGVFSEKSRILLSKINAKSQ